MWRTGLRRSGLCCHQPSPSLSLSHCTARTAWGSARTVWGPARTAWGTAHTGPLQSSQSHTVPTSNLCPSLQPPLCRSLMHTPSRLPAGCGHTGQRSPAASPQQQLNAAAFYVHQLSQMPPGPDPNAYLCASAAYIAIPVQVFPGAPPLVRPFQTAYPSLSLPLPLPVSLSLSQISAGTGAAETAGTRVGTTGVVG